MADQQRIMPPYGDIIEIKTPTLDNWAKQLYIEQKTREARQYQENQALDQMLQKDFGRIRSVDTPEVVGKYNDVKNIKKQLLFDKQLQRNPLAYNQKQQELKQAMQDMYSVINGSAEMKEANKTYNAAHLQNPDAFDDNYGTIMATQMNTPFSQLKNHPIYGDLTNADTYRYKGSNTNFNDVVTKVAGHDREITGKEEPLDKQGIQFRSPVYKTSAPPAQIFEGLVNSLDHKTERDAAYKWKQLAPEVVQKIEQDYNAIPQAKWEQMGLPGPQQINLKGGSDAEKYMRVMAMQNAINTNPTLSKYSYRTDKKAEMDYKQGQAIAMEYLKFGHQKELKKQDQNILDNWVINYWNQRFNDAKSEQPKAITSPDPNNPLTSKFKVVRQLNPDKIMNDALQNSGVYPNEVYVTQDNKVLPVFYKYRNILNDKGHKIGTEIETDANGNKIIDEELTRPLNLDQAYLSLGYKGQTKKELGGTMSGAYKEGKKESTSAPTTKKHDPLGLF